MHATLAHKGCGFVALMSKGMLLWALRNAKKYYPKLTVPEPKAKAKPRKEDGSDTKSKNPPKTSKRRSK